MLNNEGLPKGYISIGLILRDCVEPSDRLKMIDSDTGETVYIGVSCNAPAGYEKMKVKSFRLVPEVTVKDWKERGLTAPIEPEEPRDYRFKDLDIKFYKVIEF